MAITDNDAISYRVPFNLRLIFIGTELGETKNKEDILDSFIDLFMELFTDL